MDARQTYSLAYNYLTPFISRMCVVSRYHLSPTDPDVGVESVKTFFEVADNSAIDRLTMKRLRDESLKGKTASNSVGDIFDINNFS